MHLLGAPAQGRWLLILSTRCWSLPCCASLVGYVFTSATGCVRSCAWAGPAPGPPGPTRRARTLFACGSGHRPLHLLSRSCHLALERGVLLKWHARCAASDVVVSTAGREHIHDGWTTPARTATRERQTKHNLVAVCLQIWRSHLGNAPRVHDMCTAPAVEAAASGECARASCHRGLRQFRAPTIVPHG